MEQSEPFVERMEQADGVHYIVSITDKKLGVLVFTAFRPFKKELGKPDVKFKGPSAELEMALHDEVIDAIRKSDSAARYVDNY